MKKYIKLLIQSLLIFLLGFLLLYILCSIKPNINYYKENIQNFIITLGVVWLLMGMKNNKKK